MDGVRELKAVVGEGGKNRCRVVKLIVDIGLFALQSVNGVLADLAIRDIKGVDGCGIKPVLITAAEHSKSIVDCATILML